MKFIKDNPELSVYMILFTIITLVFWLGVGTPLINSLIASIIVTVFGKSLLLMLHLLTD